MHALFLKDLFRSILELLDNTKSDCEMIIGRKCAFNSNLKIYF